MWSHMVLIGYEERQCLYLFMCTELTCLKCITRINVHMHMGSAGFSSIFSCVHIVILS